MILWFCDLEHAKSANCRVTREAMWMSHRRNSESMNWMCKCGSALPQVSVEEGPVWCSSKISKYQQQPGLNMASKTWRTVIFGEVILCILKRHRMCKHRSSFRYSKSSWCKLSEMNFPVPHGTYMGYTQGLEFVCAGLQGGFWVQNSPCKAICGGKPFAGCSAILMWLTTWS